MTPPPRFAGDDAVPRGLAVTSAVTLRVIVLLGGIVLLGLFAKKMMAVVLPVIVALLLASSWPRWPRGCARASCRRPPPRSCRCCSRSWSSSGCGGS